MENSLVFDGAYPGAGVVGLSNKENPSTPTNWEVLTEDTKSLPDDGRVFYSFSNKSGFMGLIPKQETQKQIEGAEQLAEGDVNVDAKEQAVQAQQLQQVQAALSQATSLLGQIRTSLGVEADDGILAKLTALSGQAQDGATYKTNLIEQSCGAGVRALGDAFNVEAMKSSLAHLPVAEIQKVHDTYEAQAKAILGNGGRQTVGGDVDLPAGALAGAAPANPQAAGGEKTPEQLQTQAREDARSALKNTGHESIMKEAK